MVSGKLGNGSEMGKECLNMLYPGSRKQCVFKNMYIYRYTLCSLKINHKTFLYVSFHKICTKNYMRNAFIIFYLFIKNPYFIDTETKKRMKIKYFLRYDVGGK